MNRKNTQDYQMLTRVVDFSANYVDMFPKTTAAPEIVKALGTAVTALSDQAAARVSAEAAIRENRGQRSAARETLRMQLEQFAQTGRALQSDKFRMPNQRTDQALIDSGHAFAVDAEPLKKEFIRHGLAPEDIASAVEDLERAILDYTNGKAARSSAIHEFEKILDEAMGLFQRLEALVDNLLSGNPTAMASWNAARSVNHSTGRKAVTPKPPDPVPAAPAAQSAAA